MPVARMLRCTLGIAVEWKGTRGGIRASSAAEEAKSTVDVRGAWSLACVPGECGLVRRGEGGVDVSSAVWVDCRGVCCGAEGGQRDLSRGRVRAGCRVCLLTRLDCINRPQATANVRTPG
eukprot:4173625-Prymnesium_polylepis.1